MLALLALAATAMATPYTMEDHESDEGGRRNEVREKLTKPEEVGEDTAPISHAFDGDEAEGFDTESTFSKDGVKDEDAAAPKSGIGSQLSDMASGAAGALGDMLKVDEDVFTGGESPLDQKQKSNMLDAMRPEGKLDGTPTITFSEAETEEMNAQADDGSALRDAIGLPTFDHLFGVVDSDLKDTRSVWNQMMGIQNNLELDEDANIEMGGPFAKMGGDMVGEHSDLEGKRANEAIGSVVDAAVLSVNADKQAVDETLAVASIVDRVAAEDLAVTDVAADAARVIEKLLKKSEQATELLSELRA